ncbi:MAG: ribosome biogenesis GTP-binding protein YihA/YsxC [Chitinispirillaceae bacterium]
MNQKQIAAKTFSAVFVSSAAHFSDLPKPSGEEYAIVGRSNVGKSTFINHVLASGNIAKTSKKPGKTTLANLYRLEEGLFWVDLPGYGYAKASNKEKDRWGRLIADYCEKRENLSGVIWLLDIRHPGISADLQAAVWLTELDLPLLPILTKGDKLSRNMRQKNVAAYRRRFGFLEEPIIYSAFEHASREKFWKRFHSWRAGLHGD